MRKALFRYPIGSAPRTAILIPWFRQPSAWGLRSKDPVRVFAGGWTAEVAAFSPAALVGTREQLLSLIAGSSPTLTHASIVVSRLGELLLTTADRDRLWRAFRVPIFEQIVGPSGELLAAECEAHDGLHWQTLAMPQDHYAIDQTPCACGQRTPRVSSPVAAERVRSTAAYAR
ncbi:MAG: hypothetical protein ABI995_06980 [Acidobacteriota bacterium]